MNKLKYNLFLLFPFIVSGIFLSLKDEFDDFFTGEEIQFKKEDKKVLLLHFDFCSSDNYCSNKNELKKIILKNNADAYIVDTLYNSDIPKYLDVKKVIFINRINLQRKGLFKTYQRLLRIKKGKVIKIKRI